MLLQITTARVITNHDKGLLQFATGTLLQITTIHTKRLVSVNICSVDGNSAGLNPLQTVCKVNLVVPKQIVTSRK